MTTPFAKSVDVHGESCPLDEIALMARLRR